MDPEIRQELATLGMNAAEIDRLDALVTHRLTTLAEQAAATEPTDSEVALEIWRERKLRLQGENTDD